MIEYRQQRSTGRFLRKRREKREKQQSDTSNETRQDESKIGVELPHPSFHPFSRLPAELKIHVLSFVAQASLSAQHSSLTNVLPLVNHEFHRLSASDCLWQTALEQLVEKEPLLWRTEMLKLCDDGRNSDQDTNEFTSLSVHELVQTVHERLLKPGYFRMWRIIVARCMRLTLPVFAMADRRVKLGAPMSLYFFEPRYRLMMQLIMEGYPLDVRDGRRMSTSTLPTFVFANVPPIGVNSRACLVEVHRCVMEEDGTATVMMYPVAHVKLERVWERPNSHHLFYAQCVRLSHDDSSRLEQEEVAQHVRDGNVTEMRECMPCSIL